MRGVDAVRAYLDELPGITQREVDGRIARFSRRTREQYNESLTAYRRRTAKWRCDICAEECTSSVTLDEHKRKEHSEKEHSEEPGDDTNQGRDRSKWVRRPGKRWKCGQCEKDYDRRGRLRQHQKKCHGGEEASDGGGATDGENSEKQNESEGENTQDEKKS